MLGRKILSVALSVVLVVGLLPLPAYAGETPVLIAAQVGSNDVQEGELPPSDQQAEIEYRTISYGDYAGRTAESGVDDLPEAQKNALRARLLVSFLSLEEEIDVSDLRIPSKWASVYMADFIHDMVIADPSLDLKWFTLKSSAADSDHLARLDAHYEYASAEEKAEIEEAIRDVLSWVPMEAPEADQVKAVHDWFCFNVSYDRGLASYITGGREYDESLSRAGQTAYGSLVNHLAVCTGYAAGFMEVMNRLGFACISVDTEEVPSGSVGHAWNMVKVEGAWYHVDCTWDDRYDGAEWDGFYYDGDGVKHYLHLPGTEFFLRSDECLPVGDDYEHHTWTIGGGVTFYLNDYYRHYLMHQVPPKSGVDFDSYSPYPDGYSEDSWAHPVKDGKPVWAFFTGSSQDKVEDFALSASSLDMTTGSFAHLDVEMLSPVVAYTGLPKAKSSWTSSNPEIAVVDKNGDIAARGKTGTTTITCSIDGVSRSCQVTVREPVHIGSDSIEASLSSNSFEYEGKTVRPSVTVEWAEGINAGSPLKENEDYRVEWKDDSVLPGEHVVCIHGLGEFGGTVQLTYNITPRNVSSTLFNAGSVVFTGTRCATQIAGEFAGRRLVEGTDFEVVSYSNNVNAGTAYVTVEGRGSYTGRATIPFEIMPASIGRASLSVSDAVYTGNPLEPPVAGTFNGIPLVLGADYSVSYSDNVQSGVGMATITGKGNFTGSVTRKFQIGSASLAEAAVEVVGTMTYSGSAIKPEVKVTLDGKRLVLGSDFDIYGYSNNVNAGRATVTVRGMYNYVGFASAQFEIDPADISDAHISVEPCTYSGQEQKPVPSVIFGQSYLSQGVDYDLAYSDNVNVGRGSVTVSGRGNFTGETTVQFSIDPIKPVDVSLVNWAYIGEKLVYDGREKRPEISGSWRGLTLEEDVDFEVVSLSENTDAGTATATVRGLGNFTGEAAVPFTIFAASMDDVDVDGPADMTYSGAACEPSMTLRLGDVTLVPGTDYDLAYRDNVDAGWARVTATGKGNFAGSLIRTFLIGKVDVADVDVVPIAAQGYTGGAREPGVSASLGPKKLVEGVDYTLSYRNNVNVGTATAVVLATGNFTGRRLVSFDIALGDGPYDIAAADIAPIAAQAFAGVDVEPGVKAEFAGVRLAEGVDYRLSYSGNSAPGKATATVTGIGRFTGSVELPFDIVVKDLSVGRVEIGQGPFVYSGSAQEPGVSVFSDGVELTSGVDYQVEYADNVNAGTATVTVTGAGAYGGSIVRTFVISPAQISSATFADIASVTYSGVKPEPAVAATFNGEDLVAGEDGDFTVTYQSNDKAGTAQAVVEGRGNYAGVAKLPFAIVPADISRASVSEIAAKGFCGSAIAPVPAVVLDGRVLVRNVDYALSYSDNVNAGSAGVTVTGKGNYSGSVETGFDIVPADIAGASARFLTSGLIAYAASRTKTPAFELVLNGYKLVAGADYTAEPDGVGAGSRMMLVAGKGNFTGSLALPFEVTPADIASARVAKIAAQSYTGSAVEPTLSISYAGEELVAGRDFECSYADNVEPGTASVTIVGKGNFTGSGATTFAIRKAASTIVSLLSAELSPIPAQTYTGSAIVPPVELVYDGVVLSEGHDYSVTCANNTDATKGAVVRIDGMGAFTGNMMATFEIAAADIAEADATPIAAQTFTGSAIRPKTSLTFNGVAMTEGNTADYTLVYSSNTHVGTATALAVGRGNFTGTKAVTFQIEPADIAGAAVTFSPVKYSKGGADVTASVKLGGNSLVQGTDFEVVGSTAGMAVGSRKLSVSGKGDYTGTATGSITVEKASLASAEISGVPAQVAWTGSAVTLDDVVVTLDGYVLAEGVDYALSYSRNVNVGTASLYVSGRNGYAGSSAHAEFEIVKSGVAPVGDNDIAHALVALDGEAPVYSGAPVEPRLKVSLGGQGLVEGTDYTVGYSSNVNAGAAKAEIVGIGSYSGSQTVSFVIQAADISTASAGAVSVGYSAAGFVPAFEVVWNGRTLVAGTDYELPASTAGWLPGDYTVALKGRENFTGELAAKLTVSGSGSSGDDGPQKTTPVALKSLKLASVSAVYDGKAHKPVVKQVVAKSGAPKASDYTLTYWRGSAQTSDFTSAGTITVRAKGSGSGFTGTVSATYTIRAAALASVRLAASSAVYDGKAHKPVVKSVTAESGSPKSKISDYALTFWRGRVQTADFTSAGTITVKAQGKLNFAGAATATFTIAKAAPKITAKATSKAVKAKAAKKKAQAISLGAKSSSGGKLTYKVLKSNKKVKFRSGKATLSKGAKKGSYSVKVRVTSAAKGNYKQGCKDFTITFKVRG